MNSMLQFLAGTWFVCATNFPMWTKGNKQDPQFHYTATAKPQQLLDVVSYRKEGRQHTITGYDQQDKTDSAAFVWRGKGLLKLAKSRWRVVLADSTGNWAVIYFSRTLFTPEGMDIISRKPRLDTETLNIIYSKIAKDSLLSRQLPSVKEIQKP